MTEEIKQNANKGINIEIDEDNTTAVPQDAFSFV